MSKHHTAAEPPPCYAMVVPGLEPLAAEEITQDLGGEVKRTSPGLVVFRVPHLDTTVLRLRTVEDVFLLAWGSDQLSYRAEDLERIQRWTARAAPWERLLRIHHEIRPKPKGKPTFRLVTQMTGTHGYRRVDAREALAKGLVGKLPASWRHAEENASVEIWLTIQGATAVCGLRLSDRTMRHRTYKSEHLPASLRPTVAAAMVRLAEIKPSQVVLDPMCGAGTLLAEVLQRPWRPGNGPVQVWGGDRDPGALRAAESNLRRLGQTVLTRWDATRLPLPNQSVDRIVSNPPFGKQLSRPEEVGPLYREVLRELDRLLRSGGRAVLLVSDVAALREAATAVGWQRVRALRVRVLGQPATITVWRKA
ncbi:MAG: RNA methyltransferase [Gemmataceae bacterium]|nr:RNA methyltransferase [Gemmataceae bacterium]